MAINVDRPNVIVRGWRWFRKNWDIPLITVVMIVAFLLAILHLSGWFGSCGCLPF